MRFSVNDIAAEFRRFEARKSELFKPARRLITELAKQAKAEVKTTIRQPKSGRAYGGGRDATAYKLQRVGGRRVATRYTARVRAYTASAAGEAPASRTGVLVRSIRSARLKKADFGFFVFANSKTAFYRHFLEFGTRDRKRKSGGASGSVAPRPLFTPLAAKYQRLLEQRMDRELDAGLRELMR